MYFPDSIILPPLCLKHQKRNIHFINSVTITAVFYWL